MSESSSSPPTAASAPAKRACDACHRRKIKCIGDCSMPCRNCTLAALRCTYESVPQKKGPKGSRAKVISELRETQLRQPQSSTCSGYGDSSSTLGDMRTPGLLPPDVILACVDFFFLHIYPTQPILQSQRIQETIAAIDQSNEAYCFLCTLCAYVMIQADITFPEVEARSSIQASGTSIGFGTVLLDEASRIRKSFDYLEAPTVWSVVTSYFLFCNYLSLDQQNMGWFHLREATTLIITLGMDCEEAYAVSEPVEVVQKRRLFWLLFIAERNYALQHHRPLTLHATIRSPTPDEYSSETVDLAGFCHLVELFKPFDDTFVNLWNKSAQGCTSVWITKLQTRLTEALPAYFYGTESQAVNLRVSQQWLRTVVWQLSMSEGLLSSAGADSVMSFKYPIEISRDIISAIHHFSQQAMEIHGIGLVEKIFDIACTLTDVMAIVPMDSSDLEIGPRDHLDQFVSLLARLRGSQQRFLPLLLAKINETVPDMTPSLTAHAFPIRSSKRLENRHPTSRSNSSSHSTTPPSFSSPPGCKAHTIYSDAFAGGGGNPIVVPSSSTIGLGTICASLPLLSSPKEDSKSSSDYCLFADLPDLP